MSLANEASLLLIPSGYKSGKVYSVFPTDGDGDFTFSRGSDGTRKGAGGLIETMSSNIPRLDYLNSDCPSLLLEPQRTNLMLFSEEFSGTSWASLRTTITANTVISPDGAMSGNTFQRTSTSTSYLVHNISKSASAITYTTSAFIKKGSDDYFAMRVQGSYPSRVDIRFRFDTEQIYYAVAVSNFTLINSDVQNYSNGWYRLSFTYTTDTNTNLAVSFSPRASNGNIDSGDTSSNSFAYVWGAQTEVGNYLTNYIKTTSGTVTRQKDFIDGAGSSSLFNSLESTFFVEMASFLNAQINSNGIELAGVGSQNRITLQYDTAPYNQIRCDVRVLNSQQAIITTSSFDVTNFNKMAITYKLNEVKFYVNGQLIGTDTSVNTFAPNTLSEVRSTIADISNDAFNLQAKIKDLRVYDRALTQAEAIELTTL